MMCIQQNLVVRFQLSLDVEMERDHTFMQCGLALSKYFKLAKSRTYRRSRTPLIRPSIRPSVRPSVCPSQKQPKVPKTKFGPTCFDTSSIKNDYFLTNIRSSLTLRKRLYCTFLCVCTKFIRVILCTDCCLVEIN